MDEKIYYVEGIITEVKDLNTKAGNPFKAVTFKDMQGNKTEASCFDIELLDSIIELHCFNFKIEEKGQYKNILSLDTIDDELTNKFLEKVSDMMPTKTEDVKKPFFKQAPTEDKKAELYITLNGKTYVTQTGLLNEAHKKGIKSIITEMLEFKDQEIAVVKSTITGKDGSVYTGYGDATKSNVNSMIVKALLRMAETRATNRALRLFTNIGITSIEELEG